MTQTVLIGDVVKAGEITICNKLRKPLNSRERARMHGEFPYYGATGAMDTINQYRFDGNYVLVAEDGTVYGKNGICPMIQRVDGRFWVSNHAHVLQGKDLINTQYLAMALECADVRPNITGAVQLKLSKDNLLKLKILWPPRKERENILDIINPIDEKIELNRQMNQTLEQIGQALFRHYFIDNPDANNWEERSLDEIADYLNGLAMQKYPRVEGEPMLPVIKIREMSSGVTDNTDIASADIPEKYIVHSGDLLFSWSGTLIVKFWDGVDGALNQHLFKVTSDNYSEWLYYYWTKHHLDEFIRIAKSKATTMGHIQRKHLKESKVLIPPNIDELTGIFEPIINQIKNNNNQIQDLSIIRDSLLPKLISGEIDV